MTREEVYAVKVQARQHVSGHGSCPDTTKLCNALLEYDNVLKEDMLFELEQAAREAETTAAGANHAQDAFFFQERARAYRDLAQRWRTVWQT